MTHDHDESGLVAKAREHRFFIMIVASIIIALLLVMVSLGLYHRGGAAQLDFSRPGYGEVRKELPKEKDYQGFPSSGKLDKKALDEFMAGYDKRLKELHAVDTFSGDPLSFDSLQVAETQE